MSEIQMFNNVEFGQVRRMTDENSVRWIMGKDICNALGDKNSQRTLSRIDDTDKRTFEIIDSMGRKQNAVFVNESGFYALLFAMQPQKSHNKDGVSDEYPIETQRRIERIRSFKKWVTSEVLPSIRKTGGYILGEENMTDDEIMASALIVANRKLEERAARIKSLENKIAMDAPKVEFHDMVADATNCIYVSELAKLLHQNGFKIGRDQLFELLRKEGYLLVATGQWNKPSQYAMNLGLFKVVERVVDKNGYRNIQSTTFVTPKGIKYFMKRYLIDGKDRQPIMISTALN